MSLLTITQQLARLASVDVPDVAFANPDKDIALLVAFSQDAADESVRRADFGAMKRQAAILCEAAGRAVLPADLLRLGAGACLYASQPVRGGLSDDEWWTLPYELGAPRYFRRMGNAVNVWPFPPVGSSLNINYLSANWCSNNSPRWAADADTALIPEVLLVSGALWRWRRHLGLDYADHMAEYEALLADLSKTDQRMRAT